MQRYNKYIIRQLAHSTVLTALTLTSIVWLTQALRLIDFIVNQGVGIDIFLTLTLLLMPSLLLIILPIALFCAVLFTYQKLKSDSELVVMEAAGLSLMRLARPALMMGCAVALIGYLVAFYIMPMCFTQFRDMQNFLRNNYASVLLQEGVFSTPVKGLTVFVREREGSGHFRGILVHDNRDEEASVTMMAEEGNLASTPQGQRFYLTNGNRQEMRHGRLSLLNFDSYALDLSMYTHGGEGRGVDTREMFLPDLLKSDGLSQNDIERRRAELHQRLLWPAYSLTLTLVGLAILLSGEFSRRGNVKRILAAVLAVSMLCVIGITLRNATVSNVFYLLLAYANVLVPVIASLIVLRDRIPPSGHLGDVAIQRGLMPERMP